MEVISLLPPLLTMQDVEPFFMRTLREGTAQRNDARVLRELVKARSEQIDRSLMKLQERRVKITDSRMSVDLSSFQSRCGMPRLTTSLLFSKLPAMQEATRQLRRRRARSKRRGHTSPL